MRIAVIRLVLAVVFVSALVCQQAIAISIRHDVPEQQYFDLAAQFPAVGRIDRNGIGAWCTGNLVAPDKVLTAAHCTSGIGAGSFSFKLGNNVGSPTHTRTISAISVNPGYTGNEAGDMSVMTLSSPITDVTPLKISSQNSAGLLGTMVGFGYHGNGLNFNFAFDNLKRAAQNDISQATSNTVRTDFDNPNGSTSTFAPATALALEGTTAGGDSGGPIMADFGYGNAIVGILCCGFNNFGVESRYGDISIWAPVNRQANIDYLENQGLTVLDGSLAGDFNGDGDYDCADINALTTAIASGTFDIAFDMDGNGTLDVGDRDNWLATAGAAKLASGNPYLLADADLDGTVDGSDFIIWNANRFTNNANYCDGDFNADGVIDGNDFINWNANSFQSSDTFSNGLPSGAKRPFFAHGTSGQTVPEPTGCILGMLCGIGFLRKLRS